MRSSEDLCNDRRIRRIERFYKRLLEYTATAGLGPRLEHRPDPTPGIAFANRTQRLLHRRRMMRKVVIDFDPVHFTAHFEAPLNALKRRQGFLDRCIVDAQFVGSDNHSERILDIEDARQRYGEAANVRFRPENFKSHAVTVRMYF